MYVCKCMYVSVPLSTKFDEAVSRRERGSNANEPWRPKQANKQISIYFI